MLELMLFTKWRDNLDASGNASVLTLASPGATNSLGANKALIIDGIVPSVSSVASSTSNGIYKIGETVAITVISLRLLQLMVLHN